MRRDGQGVWDVVAETSEELRDRYGHTPADQCGAPEGKDQPLQKDGYMSLISGKVGNRSAAVVDGDAARCIIALKRSMTPVYTDAQLLDEYNRRARENGWKRLKTVKAITDFLNRPEVAPSGGTRATESWRQRRSSPTGSRQSFHSDGTRCGMATARASTCITGRWPAAGTWSGPCRSTRS